MSAQIQEQELRFFRGDRGLDISYAAETSADRWLRDDSVLTLIRFGTRTEISTEDPRQISLGLPPLGPQRYIEVWRTRLPVIRGHDQDLHYAMDGEILFGALLIAENGNENLESAARAGYSKILKLTRKLGYSHLVRLWNYFPDINVEVNGLERYRSFCVGRYEAFAAAGYQSQRLAAASAIGTHAPGLLLYFLAAAQPGTPIENPRQVSAFRYPKVYSPRHPLFSRAMLKRWNAGTHLYVSGTASVVGHRTCHVGDTLEQLRETARNIGAIVSRANELQPLALKAPAQLTHVKIYVRRAEDFFRIQSEFDRLFSPALPRAYLLADICRADLLLELDAFYCEPLTA
jgi:chorismate lyase/3-hydroxybenzoate synthase